VLLVCIDDSAGEGDSEILTYGKTYEVEQSPIMTMAYDIIGDNNIGVSVIKHRFITIESFREMKLNSLLE
jgi:hypothetical protein